MIRKILSLIVILLVVTTACKKSFLDVDPKALQIDLTYYKTADDVTSALVGCYDPVGWEGTEGYANFLIFAAASDECYSGGGSSSDLPYFQAVNNYTLTAAVGPQLEFWQQYYTGIARANNFLYKLGNSTIGGLGATTRARYTAEIKVLRAYFYFNLVKLFKNIPFYTTPLEVSDIYNLKQVSPEIVYAQIEKDLKDAISEPALPDQVDKATEGGRMSKGAATALLGKVYIYEKKWSAASEQLHEINGTPGVVNKYGYALLPNFADIFKPDNNFNSESIFEITHNGTSASQRGSARIIEGLLATVMVGPRSYSGDTFVFGWGACPIIPAFSAEMHNDPRYPATISDIDSLVKLGKASYSAGYLNTGKFVRKFAPLKAFRPLSGGNPVVNYPQNYIEIRLADTYLLEAEALLNSGGSTDRASLLLNAVRARAGLAPIVATLENVYRERKLELATEGHRWFDLVRWGKAPGLLAFKGFVSGKNEIFPIPLQELNNTKLVQNPNY